MRTTDLSMTNPATTSISPDAETPQYATPARVAAHHGQPSTLGARYARRRISIRSRLSSGRELFEVDRLSAFFDIIHQDPVLSQVKLIAEPWDVGEGGYQVETSHRSGLNGMPIIETPCVISGVENMLASPRRPTLYRVVDLYRSDTRRPTASINFITCHDGFTLSDLVSYNEKHNDDNGEESRDGESHNRSWNHGAEGTTDDASINELRHRQRRNLIATLLLSQGVPMLLSGDEIGRTQRGNNNAYCHDSELSWVDWENLDSDMHHWVQRLMPFDHRIRSSNAADGFKVVHFVTMTTWHGSVLDGEEMTSSDWEQGFAQAVGVFLNGEAITIPDRFGNRIIDDTFMCIFSASPLELTWTLPPSVGARHGRSNSIHLDQRSGKGATKRFAGAQFIIPGRTTLVLERSRRKRRSLTGPYAPGTTALLRRLLSLRLHRCHYQHLTAQGESACEFLT